MKHKLHEKGITTPMLVLTGILCLIGLLTTIYVRLTTNALFSYFYCLATVGFVLLPMALMLLFRWKMNFGFYLFFSLYAMGPLLGAVYNFYYYTEWWDDLLHAMAGTVFAVVGTYLAVLMNRKQPLNYLLAALFGVLFSVGIAVAWEIYEFGADMLLHSDMQSDTVINLVSTKINLTDGSVRIYENITDTVVNGQSMGISGYLDIGLIDTMTDLMVETAGAVLYFIYAVIDKDRHPLITSR